MNYWTELEEASAKQMWFERIPASRIGLAINRPRNSVIGRAHRHKWPRKPIEKKAEPKPAPLPRAPEVEAPDTEDRKRDQRDLDILYDVQEGHMQADVARHWGVGRTLVHKLERARKEAN